MNLLNRFFPKKKDSNKLYTEALEALLEGDIENAVFKLKDLVQYDTNNIRAYLRLGDIFRENLKVEQALKIHQSLILRKRLSKALQCEIYMSLARDFFELKNGEKVKLPFTDKEYNNRVSNLRSVMNKNNLDMVILTSMHNVAYYTGFIYCSFGRPYGCVITQNKISTINIRTAK